MKPKISYGYRGEEITYHLANRAIEIGFTYMHSPRFYTETITQWEDGAQLTADEKRKVFTDVLHFVGERDEKPIVVINRDDPSRELWEELCAMHAASIEKLEYTSKEEQEQFERRMYLDFIQAGKKVNIEGVEINSEKELDDFLQKRRRDRSS